VQWQVSTKRRVHLSPVSGATSDTLTITSTTLAQDGNEYEAVSTNGTSPDAVTNPAALSVSPDVAPSITTNPRVHVVRCCGLDRTHHHPGGHPLRERLDLRAMFTNFAGSATSSPATMTVT
jgi:hypothetical protein